MAMRKSVAVSEPSRLQRQLAGQILQHIRDKRLQVGDPLTAVGLAEILKVSRTPVRGALDHLANFGVVGPAARGFEVRASPATLADVAVAEDPSEDEALYMRIAADYVADRLPSQVSEADLMRRYVVNRSALLRVLQRMAREFVIERNQGHGWNFAPLLRATQGHDESYRFRRALEPAALLEPTFVLDPAWAERSRAQHEEIRASVKDLSMVHFFDVNAAFHEGLAAASGNLFFLQAIQGQNRLRRLVAYVWTYGDARVIASCEEHLAVLDALEAGDRPWAATLMRRHIELAGELAPVAGAGDSPPG